MPFYDCTRLAVYTLAILAVPSLVRAFSLPLPGFIANGVHKGEATFYDSDGRGHCSLDPSGDGIFGAMASALWSTAAVCGVCAEITHKDKTVRVPIVDECPSCSAGSIDLSRGAFRALAAESAGRIDISWKIVPCPVQGALRYRYKPDANAQYLAVQLLNYAIPVRSVECRAANGGGSWQTLQRSVDNYFIGSTPANAGSSGLDFRVTPYGGAAVEDSGIAFSPGQTVAGKQSLGSISVSTGEHGETRISLNTTGGKGVSATIGSNGINIDLDGIRTMQANAGKLSS
ncbi:RlpA-like double-psi beta-barrel-protein domain-containing protein-containing protein [Syncephalis pseudoplumigaleata]|uniref:RlpA-like double-psi beta-barrel-protein domain-containing protein-containing protein n=1 Tax=Syncephalis pseudoplumigaleata TaxID=1712513 RepID=A0A4P9YUI7_9FUNG|nr:RlpA-like double-psi beta-barrel-protein domain-containing protein-containing protein [Syncephalis pseudoplumigaleata]|eukprot:RKP23455.1 RlpA-like double-psi beta-barrel-protein domain-containing protein-containing protein [Syncephalis pseudoplumigaleata]